LLAETSEGVKMSLVDLGISANLCVVRDISMGKLATDNVWVLA